MASGTHACARWQNRVAWDGTNLTVASQNLTIDANGVRVLSGTSFAANDLNGFSFTAPTGSGAQAGTYGFQIAGSQGILMSTAVTDTRSSDIYLQAKNSTTGELGSLNIYADRNSSTSGMLLTGTDHSITGSTSITLTAGTLTANAAIHLDGAVTQASAAVLYPGSVSGLSSHQTSYYLASTGATSGLVTPGSFDAVQAFIGRQGSTGATAGNRFSIWWTGSAAQLWIDSTNVGNITLVSDRRAKKNITPIDVDWPKSC